MLLYARSSTPMHLKLDLNSRGWIECLIEFQSGLQKRFMLFSKLVYTTAPSFMVNQTGFILLLHSLITGYYSYATDKRP